MPDAVDLFNQLHAAKSDFDQAQSAVETAQTAVDNAQQAVNANANAETQSALANAELTLVKARLTASQAELKVAKLNDQVSALGANDQGFTWGLLFQSSTLMLAGAAVLVAYIMHAVCSGVGGLQPLLDGNGHTRGLLTFLLGSSTIGIAFMLVYQAFQIGATTDSLRFAREIFGSLIAVLGTIVGFYFGAAKDEPGKDFGPDEQRIAAAATETVRMMKEKIKVEKTTADQTQAAASNTEATETAKNAIANSDALRAKPEAKQKKPNAAPNPPPAPGAAAPPGTPNLPPASGDAGAAVPPGNPNSQPAPEAAAPAGSPQ